MVKISGRVGIAVVMIVTVLMLIISLILGKESIKNFQDQTGEVKAYIIFCFIAILTAIGATVVMLLLEQVKPLRLLSSVNAIAFVLCLITALFLIIACAVILQDKIGSLHFALIATTLAAQATFHLFLQWKCSPGGRLASAAL